MKYYAKRERQKLFNFKSCRSIIFCCYLNKTYRVLFSLFILLFALIYFIVKNKSCTGKFSQKKKILIFIIRPKEDINKYFFVSRYLFLFTLFSS